MYLKKNPDCQMLAKHASYNLKTILIHLVADVCTMCMRSRGQQTIGNKGFSVFSVHPLQNMKSSPNLLTIHLTVF